MLHLPGRASRALLYATRALIGAAIVAPIWFWKGGVLELEVLQFITRYLDDRSLLRKIFDPYTNDFRTYQARELSYFLDYLDARIFQQLMGLDVALFIPATAVLSPILATAIFVAAMRRYPGLSPLTSSLLLLLYLTNYVHVVTMGMFYRSTKPLLAPVLMATAFLIAAVVSGRDGQVERGASVRRLGHAIALFSLFCLMSLLDRQGFFYAVVGFAVVGAHAIVTRRRWDLLVAGAAAIGCMVAYNVWVGPWLIQSINGYVPSLAYQEVPRDQLLRALTPYRQSVELLGESVTILLGSTSVWAGAIGLAAIVVAGVLRWEGSTARRAAAGGLVGLVLLSQVVMFALMIVRHPPLYDWIDHRYWYYPLPFQALLLVLIGLLLARAIRGWTGWKIALVHVALVAAIAGNVAHWTHYRERMLTSRWFSRVYPQTELLKASLQAGRPDERLIPQYRQFYDLCLTLSPGLRDRAAR